MIVSTGKHWASLLQRIIGSERHGLWNSRNKGVCEKEQGSAVDQESLVGESQWCKRRMNGKSARGVSLLLGC